MGDALSDLLAPDQDEPGDLDGTLQRIAAAAHTVFGADLCTLFAINPITGRFLAEPTIHGERRAPLEALPPPREEGLTREVLRHGLLLIDDVRSEPRYDSAFCRAEGVRAFGALVLHTTRQPKPLAVLYVDFRKRRRLRNLRERLTTFSREASRHLQSTWFLRRYRSVTRIGHDLNRGLESHQDLFRKVQLHLGGILDVSDCLLLAIHQAATSTLDLYAHVSGRELPPSRHHGVSGLCGHVMREGRYFLRGSSEVALPAPLERLPGDGSPEPASLLYVPLQLGDEPLGVIAVQHHIAFAFEQEDRHIVELLANHLALAVYNLRLFAALRHLNDAGQTLTRHLAADDVLQLLVEQIRGTAGSDVAVLYPYLQATHDFERPARVGGELFHPDLLQRGVERADDMALLAVTQERARFASDSGTLYRDLGGDMPTRRGNFEVREKILSVAALPLKVGAEQVGVLFVNYRSPQSFDEAQQLLLGGLASYAAIAVKNAREFGTEASRHRRRLEMLQEIDQALSRTADLKQLLHAVLDVAAAHFHSHGAAAILFDPQRQELKIEAAAGERAEQREGQCVRLADGEGVAVRVVKTKTPVLISDVRTTEWSALFLKMGSSTRSEMDVPLLDDRNEVVGVLNFESPETNAFGQDDLDLVRTLAGQAVLAVRKGQDFEAARRLARERQTLIDVGKEITRRLEVDAVLDLVVERAIEITTAEAGALLLLRGGRLEVAAEIPLGKRGGSTMSLHEGIVGVVARTGQSLNVEDVDHPDWRKIYLRVMPGIRSELAVPLKLEGPEPSIRGVLNVESPMAGHFGRGDERLLEDLADLALVALQNAERYEKAEKRRSRLQALHRVGHQIIRSPEDPDRVLEAVLEQALRLFGAATAVDLDLHENSRLVTMFLARWDEQTGAIKQQREDYPPQAVPPTRGIMARVLQTRSPYRTGSAQTDPYYVGGKRVQSELAVPLTRGSGSEDLVGVLNVESTRPEAFDDDDQEALDLFAAQAVVALDNARNFQRAERRQRRFEALSRVVSSLGEINDEERLDEAYRIVVEIARDYFGGQVVVRRLDVRKGELALKAVARPGGAPPFPSMPLGRGINGQVEKERRPIVVPDADDPPPDTWPIERSDPKAKSLAVFPVQLGSSYYGNLALSHEVRNHFLAADTSLLEGLAKELAVTIQRVDKINEIQEARRRAADAEAMSWFAEGAFEFAHELGNDLGLVPRRVGKIRLALERGKPAAIGKELDEIYTRVTKILERSKRVRDEFATTGRPAPERIPAKIILQDVDASFHPASKRVIVKLAAPEDLGLVDVVHGEIETALRHFLFNAQEAMPEGGEIIISGERDEREVRLQVRDTGEGIAKENLDKIWLPRFSTKRSSGFGLFSARLNVLRNGGIITVASEVGKGSSFTIHLPRAARGGPEDVSHGPGSSVEADLADRPA